MTSELIPVTSRQPAGELIRNVMVRLPLFSARPSQSKSITVPWPVPNYTAWLQRCTGVKNLSKVVALEQELSCVALYRA